MKKQQMDIETANQTLQNVFTACNHKPNTIPLEAIIKQKKARTCYVTMCMWICALFFIATLLSPLYFTQTNLHVTRLLSTTQDIAIEGHDLTDDCFTIKLRGDNIDYEKITILKEDGTVSAPDHIIPKEHIIQIDHPVGTINISIPDRDGHTLLAVLTIDKED